MSSIVISDPEGFSIDKIYTDHIKTASGDLGILAKDVSTKLYICGDILDSTKTNLDDSKLKFKSNNLRNIKLILDNPNIILLFGNRDLNKLKTKFLCELDNTSTTTTSTTATSTTSKFTTTDIDNFNKGMIRLDFDTYQRLKNTLVTNSKTSKIWTAEMKHWYPFWSKNVNPTEKFNANEKKVSRAWATEPDYSKYPFLERFKVIFGADTIDGTMSAQNLLNTIYLELGEMLVNFDKLKSDESDDDYKAFLVLAIFRSMVLTVDYSTFFIDIKISKEFITSEIFKGWLYRLYTDPKNKVAECLEYCCSTDHCGPISKCGVCTTCHKNIVLLSHGGIPEQLIKSFRVGTEDNPQVNKLDELKNWLETKTEGRLTNPTNLQYGGFINNSSDKIIYNNQYLLKTYVDKMNKIFKDSINAVLNKSSMIIPNKDMLFLLITAAETEIITTDKDYEFKSTLYSPIVSGFEVMRNNHFFIQNTTLYQVFGHKPVGYGATVDLFNPTTTATTTADSKSTTYHITLDTSNTFVGTSTHNITEKDMSFNCFYIKDKSFRVYSKINATFRDKLKPFDSSVTNIDITKKDNIPSIIYSDNADLLMGKISDKATLTDLVIDYDINSYTDVFKLMIDQKLIDNKINFHGVIRDNSSNIKYFIFTYNVPNSFDKTLYYISLDDLKKLTFDPSQISQISQIAGYSNTSENLKLINKISELKYKLKKYKLKYAESKKY